MRVPSRVFCIAALFSSAWVAAAPQTDTFKFESRVNVVLVPVLVRDSHGRVVQDLKQEDFQVFDRGKRQTISHFTVQKRATEHRDPPPVSQPAAATGSRPDVPAPPVEAPAERFIVFLFDDLHLTAGDLARVRIAAKRILAESLMSTDAAAVVSTSGRVNSGFTRDRAKLEDAVAQLTLQTLFSHVDSCPNISHYEADLIVNMGDPDALAAAAAEAMSCADRSLASEIAKSSAQRELARGDQATHITLELVGELVQKMGAAPGQRTLVLISPGFFVSSSPIGHADVNRVLDAAAQANVTISALDSRGLYTNMLDASEVGALPSDVDRSGKAQRLKEEHRRDAAAVDGAIMDELASSTAGTYFHDSNDLAGGFQRVTLAPECVYLLEFSPQDARRDGSFHRLSIKVSRKGAHVRARSGYFAEKPAAPGKPRKPDA